MPCNSKGMYAGMYDGCAGLLQQTELVEGEAGQTSPADGSSKVDPASPTTAASAAAAAAQGPKRLHVSNIPFRFREADLRNLLGVSVSHQQ